MTASVERGLLRWLHLSDFHVGKDDYAQRKMFRYILEYVRAQREARLEPHLVFITGDVANMGRQDEYALFNEEFFLPLVDVLGSGSDERIFIVPGNHDTDRKKARLVDRQVIAKKAPRFFDPTKEGLEYRQEILPRFEAYSAQDLSSMGGRWLSSPEGAFIVQRNMAGSRIGIVGVNTAWLSQDEKDRHELTPGMDIVEAALDQVASCDIRFVLGHHPLSWLKDSDADTLGALFGKHQVIYLHGHLHQSEARTFEAAGRRFLTLQSGASFQAREDEMWLNRLLWCELDPNEQVIRAKPQVWSGKDKEWKLDGMAFPEGYRVQGMDQWFIPLPGSAAPPKDVTRKVEKISMPAG